MRSCCPSIRTPSRRIVLPLFILLFVRIRSGLTTAMVIIYRSLPFKTLTPYPRPYLPPDIIACCRTGRVTASSSVRNQREVHSSIDNGVSESLKLKMSGGIVALGKFEALHIGHRELAIQASKVGAPFLLSFVGIAEVLGWEPRAPIVADCDRKRVLLSWAPYCGYVAPQEFLVEFSSVRHLTPRQFVEKLSKEFGVKGVVAGENYRFGYKASGDASALVTLCKEYDIGAYIISSVMDKNRNFINKEYCDLKDRGQVSSTRVRHALSNGDMKYVADLLGRQHRLMLTVKGTDCATCSENKVSMPKSCLLNLPPKEGVYEQCLLLIHDENPIPCRVTIGSTHIYLDLDEAGTCIVVNSQDTQLLGIEFGESRA